MPPTAKTKGFSPNRKKKKRRNINGIEDSVSHIDLFHMYSDSYVYFVLKLLLVFSNIFRIGVSFHLATQYLVTG